MFHARLHVNILSISQVDIYKTRPSCIVIIMLFDGFPMWKLKSSKLRLLQSYFCHHVVYILHFLRSIAFFFKVNLNIFSSCFMPQFVMLTCEKQWRSFNMFHINSIFWISSSICNFFFKIKLFMNLVLAFHNENRNCCRRPEGFRNSFCSSWKLTYHTECIQLDTTFFLDR